MGEEYTIHTLRNCPKARAILSFGGLDSRLLDNEYNIWNNHNNAIFRGKEKDAQIVWEWARSLGNDFRIFNLMNTPLIPKTPRLQKWNKPHCAFVKINVDEAINDNSVGLRVIARDYDGETRMTVEWAEVEALREGIMWAHNKNIMRAIF
ncbi:hypothetical protein V6Z11_A11G235600 [Gossypium hirsutum]